MAPLYVAYDKRRLGLLLPEHNRLFYLPGTNGSQLSELIHKQLQSLGVPSEKHASVVSQAEEDYEHRIKVHEAEQEGKRLMAIRAEGGKLVQVGFRKWKRAFYPGRK